MAWRMENLVLQNWRTTQKQSNGRATIGQDLPHRPFATRWLVLPVQFQPSIEERRSRRATIRTRFWADRSVSKR